MQFIACSETIKNEFKINKNIDLECVQNGVDTEKFHPINSKNKKRDELKLPSDKNIFISVGSLIIRKDMKTLIEGFKKFNTSNQSIQLIAGEGNQKGLLEEIADNSIMFLGNIQNVSQYLQCSDYFLSASSAEGDHLIITLIEK